MSFIRCLQIFIILQKILSKVSLLNLFKMLKKTALFEQTNFFHLIYLGIHLGKMKVLP